MFNKTADTEKVDVLDEAGCIRRVFARLGKDTASELEILRAAKELGITVSGLYKHCTPKNGQFVLKG